MFGKTNVRTETGPQKVIGGRGEGGGRTDGEVGGGGVRTERWGGGGGRTDGEVGEGGGAYGRRGGGGRARERERLYNNTLLHKDKNLSTSRLFLQTRPR